MAFSLSMYPWVYKAQYDGKGGWTENYDEKPHKTPAQEAALPEAELQALLSKRNSFPELPPSTTRPSMEWAVLRDSRRSRSPTAV